MTDDTQAARVDANWVVRLANSEDMDTLGRFSALTALETEGIELNPAHISASLQFARENHGMDGMFIAEVDGHPVGSCILNGMEWTEWRNGIFYWITGLYVVPEHRRTGVRFGLYHKAYDWARSKPGALGLRSYVHKNTNIDAVIGDGTAEFHGREEFGLKHPHQTDYRIIEVVF